MLRLPAAACLLFFAMLSSLQPLSVRAEESKDSGKLRVYFGTYTGADSRGIYVCELDLADGSLSEPRLAGEVKNPSFLALHPKRPLLYARPCSGQEKTTRPTMWRRRRRHKSTRASLEHAKQRLNRHLRLA